jgi:hypothetical protein
MTIEELKQTRDTIADRAKVKRSYGDIEGAELDEETARRMSIQLLGRKRPAEQIPSS